MRRRFNDRRSVTIYNPKPLSAVSRYLPLRNVNNRCPHIDNLL